MTLIAIGVVSKRPNDRVWLLRLREWSAKQPLAKSLRINITVEVLPSPDAACHWRAEMPGTRIVLAAGFSRNEFPSLQLPDTPLEVPLLLVDPGAAGAEELPSATFLEERSIILCGEVISHVRKAVLRVALRPKVCVRPPNSEAEIADYFSLRYKIWSNEGFLNDQNKRSRTKWEIDYADRTAVPLVAISPEGRIIGCTRLVRNLGQEDGRYAAMIANLLKRTGDQSLTGLFNYPHKLVHPFDVLEEFHGFRALFKTLIQNRVEVAEIGRVAVDPEHRGQCLSEVLVDTAISLAERRRVSHLFLACHDALRLLYEKSGFRPVEGLKADKFLNIALPSIVMQRSIVMRHAHAKGGA